jgi:hypothetical protein
MSGPMTYTVEQAAERLGPAFTIDWLAKRAARDEIPHGKTGNGTGRGGRLYFTETHLAEILLMFERRPESVPAPSQPGDFTPVTRRRAS